MSGALWLARRELHARAGSFLLAAVAVAGLAGLTVSTELLASGRQRAVAAEFDQIGAPLHVLPEGVGASELTRLQPGPAKLPADAEPRVRSVLGPALRRVEMRLLAGAEVEGGLALLGLQSPRLDGIPPGSVGLAQPLADRLRLGGGDPILLRGRRYPVAKVLPVSGLPEDFAVQLHLTDLESLLGAAGVNDLAIYLEPGASPAESAASLQAAGLNAVRIDRGEVAESKGPRALASGRLVLLGVAALASLLALGASAWLNARARRVELATLVAVGTGPGTLAVLLLLRSALAAALGALAGGGVGALFAAFIQESVPAVGVLRMLAFVTGVSTLIGALAALPALFARSVRDPVPELQLQQE